MKFQINERENKLLLNAKVFFHIFLTWKLLPWSEKEENFFYKDERITR